MNKNNIKVSLVGAGPGDPRLITLAGADALKSADAVLYDALVSPELLALAPQAIKLFVGKRKGNHSYSQNDINKLIVDHAFEYGHVVRLKGGDPFIFGRGSEEIEYIESFGIETEVIPGVSSVTSVPSREGISLTKRGVSESFWVITGTTSNRELSKDVHLAAKSKATVVFLMGMSNLPSIVNAFQFENKGDLPVAIIQNGYMPNEKSAIGTINSIVEIVERKKVSNPAIIVIGEVVKHSHKLSLIFEEVEHYYLKHE